MTMAAHPSFLAGGVAHHKGIIGNVLGDYTACGNETVSTKGYSADNGGVGTNGGSPPDKCLLVETVPVNLRSGIRDVGQNTGRAQENIIFNGRSRVDGDIVLHLDVIADDDTTVDINILAKNASLTNLRALHNVAEVPDLGSSADDGSVVNVGGFVDGNG